MEPLVATAPPFVPAPGAESTLAVQVERGLVFVEALNNSARGAQKTLDYAGAGASLPPTERLIDLARSPRLAEVAVVDCTGHHRPAYRGLLVYSWLQAFRLAYETLPRNEFGRWEEGLRPWCDLLEETLGTFDWSGEALPAGRGAGAAEVAISALALYVAGKVFVRDAWTDFAADAFGRFMARQQASGAFLCATPADNPETHWYHELILLHALASYAVQAEDRTAADSVARATSFHLNETQPDHATSQPWGLFAFAWNPATQSLADQLLHAHAVAAGGPSGATQAPDGVPLMLLADALYCLRLFAPETAHNDTARS